MTRKARSNGEPTSPPPGVETAPDIPQPEWDAERQNALAARANRLRLERDNLRDCLRQLQAELRDKTATLRLVTSQLDAALADFFDPGPLFRPHAHAQPVEG